jgi:hypothetical protein
MTDQLHLTEEERHARADGTLPPERSPSVEAHLARCEECASDVASIERLMTKAHQTPLPPASLDELWPAIRERIDERKLVPLTRDVEDGGVVPRRSSPRRWITLAVAAAAAALAITLTSLRERASKAKASEPPSVAQPGAPLFTAGDSVRAYEAEARMLLNRLELQRALLRPEAAHALDRDLGAIDAAIAELKDAIVRDPNNPALRQLLASSYRQKVELLKRVGNAS